MKFLTTKQLAQKAGITKRTLHHYDKIGLLTPSRRSENGYRQYSFQDQILLQQILFFRELGLPLKEIKQKIHNPSFDIIKSLQAQKSQLQEKLISYKKLLNTIDITIKNFNPKNMSHDLYEGFPEESKQYYEEAATRWPDKFQESAKNLKKLSPKQRQSLIQEGKDIATQLGQNLKANYPVDSLETQGLIQSYHHHMNKFYNCTPEIFEGLGKMYISDPRFTKYYEDITPGLADYVSQAIHHYVSNI